MKKTALFIALSISVICKAQINFCGFDSFKETQAAANPLFKQQEAEQNELIRNYIVSLPASGNKERVTYTIPMVFHIVHLGGPENVPDSNVVNAVNELNLRFQNAAPYTDPTGNPVNIQFCLASVDPWGNPTTGITRDTSYQTDVSYTISPSGPVLDMTEIISLKNVNRWCPATYLNVWVVRNSMTFSSYPAPNSSAYDGIVGVYPFLTGGYVLSHEVAHYFNIYHTFEGGCINFNCMLDGDHVCDTPPQAGTGTSCGTSSCATDMSDTSGFNPFTSDQVDLPNYMGSAPCPFSFSQGQAARMEAALTLLRPSLLLSNGCGSNPGGAMPVASFTIDSSFALCTGKLGFRSTSTNSLYTAWDFDSDGRTDDTGDSVMHTFTAAGFYSVRMTVSGYGGSDSITHIIHVYVNPYSTYPISTMYSGLVTDPVAHLPAACIGTMVTLNGVPGMASYLWSTGATTPSITFAADSSRLIYLTVTTTSGRSITNCVPFKVITNRPLTLTLLAGDDTVNCQQLVTLRLLPNPYWFPGTNTWYRNGDWYSANQFVVSSYGTPPGLQNIWVTNNVDPIGCVTNSDTFTYFVNPPPPIILTQQWNVLTMPFKCLHTTWFKDGVPLSVNDSLLTVTSNGCYFATCSSCGYYYSDTICITNAGIHESDPGNTVTIYPNPFTSQTTVSFSEDQHHTILKITDALGKEIRTATVTGKQYLLDKAELPPGIYFIRIENEKKNVVNKRIVIQ